MLVIVIILIILLLIATCYIFNLKKVLESNYLNYLKKQENDSTKRKGHLYNDR